MYILVEDSNDFGQTVYDYLSVQGFSVHWIKTIAEARLSIKRYHTDIVCIIVDRMLPDGDGTTLCAWIKEQYTIPIIISTARIQIDDRLQGFAAGADDYITKPYDLRELVARIRAISTRHKPQLYEIKNCIIDTQAMTIFCANIQKDCTATERIAIILFCKNQGNVVSRSVLIDTIWGGNNRDIENNLDVLISGIRKKLGKGIITTIKGVGYKME